MYLPTYDRYLKTIGVIKGSKAKHISTKSSQGIGALIQHVHICIEYCAM
jgi:hypothetical protein